jgi:hypothetical protein
MLEANTFAITNNAIIIVHVIMCFFIIFLLFLVNNIERLQTYGIFI